MHDRLRTHFRHMVRLRNEIEVLLEGRQSAADEGQMQEWLATYNQKRREWMEVETRLRDLLDAPEGS